MSAQLSRQTDQSMQECIRSCTECHRVCQETVTYCLQRGGKYAEGRHVRLLLDCAEICQTSANFMIRGSNLHARTCGLCAEVCERCTIDCEQMDNDEQMRKCAEACR